MLLLLDVGNTQTDVAECNPAEGSFRHTWRFRTDRDLDPFGWQSLITSHALEFELDISSITDVAISSVVPPVTTMLTSMFREWLHIEPLVVSPELELGVRIAVDRAESVGTDRLCNATAAYHMAGGAVIVVDAGTATKIEAVSGEGVYLGGAIAPGIEVSLDALVARAAKLDTVSLKFPKDPIGANTVEAMQSGLVLGHLVMIEGMIERFRQRVGIDAPSILTGGYGTLFWKESALLDRYEPDLTLLGLLGIWQLNQTRGHS